MNALGTRERGSAVIAALLASACFALLAAQVARTSRSSVVSANAGLVHARLAAAADAGLALAVKNLAADPSNGGWGLTEGIHAVNFADANLAISVEDERGKIPLNSISKTQIRSMFQRGGADPSTVEALVSAFLDWRDPNRHRATGDGSAATQNATGGFRSIEELALLPGLSRDVYNTLAPSVTVTAGDSAFEPRTASPLALTVMSEGAEISPDTIERLRELAGQRTALDTEPPINPIGRALTIRITAEDGRDARLKRATIVQLTQQLGRPYVVRLRPLDR